MKFLLIGDIVGRSGRRAVRELMPGLIEQEKIDFVIANGENSAGGFGITKKVAEELYGYGIDVLTMGNHTWDNKDIFNFIDQETKLLRPYNLAPDTPGRGYEIYSLESGIEVAVVNLLGRVFLDNVDCPFRALESLLTQLEADLVLVDFHAEATSEKIALGRYFDGKVATVFGTHTHVQTADQQILKGGTAYITDLGLTGAIDSILGMKSADVIKRLTTNLPQRFSVASGDVQLSGLVVEVDLETGLALSIKRVAKLHSNS